MCPSDGYNLPELVGAVSGASFAIRRCLWDQLKGFDKDLFMYYEDTDLCWRARLAGFSSLYSPASIVYHDYSVRTSTLTYSYSERNRLVLILKNWKGLTLFLLLPSLLLAEIIDWGYMLMVGWEGVRAKLQAYNWLIRNIPSVLRSRANAQLSREKPDWVLLKSCTYLLTPRLRTGGRIGRFVVYVCNLWFAFHYKVVLFLARKVNI
jgi:GT2 family glycosyltransferase